MKPKIQNLPTADDIDAITETKNGKKVIAKVRQQFDGQVGATIFFLEDGSEVIENDAGEVLAAWPEYVAPVPEEVEADE